MTKNVLKTALPGCRVGHEVEIARSARPLRDWAAIRQTEHIAVQNPDGSTVSGSVDMVGSGGDTAWIWLDHGGGRILLHKDEGVKIYKL
jgi:hypothetical protein